MTLVLRGKTFHVQEPCFFREEEFNINQNSNPGVIGVVSTSSARAAQAGKHAGA